MAEFTRAFRVQGMDTDAVPRFQMVPSGGRRFVILRDGVGMTVTMTTSDRAVCNFTEILGSAMPAGDPAPRRPGDRFFRLEAGATAAGAALVATGASASPLQLDIQVKNRLQVLVGFNFLRDTAGHRTARPEANVGQFMQTVRFVWDRQANVDIVQSGGIRRPRVARDLTDTIEVSFTSFRPAGSVVKAIEDTAATGANLNVFFVHRIQRAGSTGDLDAVTTIDTQKDGIANPGLCLFEDAAGKDQALSLSHEIGHHLGLRDRDLPTKDLMHGGTGARGLNLTKADVNTANP